MIDPVGAKPHKLDMAGRIKLRDEERAGLGDKMIMSCGFDNCIAIYTPDAWQRFVGDFQRLAQQDPNAHDLKRLLVAPGETCEVDGQGRVRLPEFLMRWADLGGGKLDAFIMPVGEGRWECWESSKWQEFVDLRSRQLKELAVTYFGKGSPAEEEAKQKAQEAAA